jgi:dTDP-4-amino-4,6-dideoxygalactose transaminase/predicted dehydrogenase
MPSIATRATNKLKRIILENTDGIRGAAPAVIVGGGVISATHIAGYRQSVVAFPAAVCDPNPLALGNCLASYPRLKSFLSMEEMLKRINPKLASVCTWPQLHLPIVKALVASGVKGILCEKPLTLRLDEAKEMAALCSQHNIKLAGAHQYRFHDAFRFAANAVQEGRLGQIKSIEGCIGSSLANNGPHLVDTIRFILGDRKVESVQCECTRENGTVSRGYPAEESAAGTLYFEGGIPANILTGTRAPKFFEISVIGDKSQITITPSGVKGSLKPSGLNADPKHAHPRMFKEFAYWVSGKQSQFAADAVSSVATVEAVLALYESARLGQRVQLPLANEADLLNQLYPCDIQSSPLPNIFDGLDLQRAANLAVNGGTRAVTSSVLTGPTFGISEIVAVSKVVKSRQLGSTGGTEVKAFEKEMAKMYSASDAVSSTSGTASIHVALAAINPEPGDEIITTPITDMGSIIPIIACNCVPVFADVDPTTGNLTAETIQQQITARTKAVIVVHLFGRPANIGPIRELLNAKGIALIEDCAQAHYADTEFGKIGTVGDFGCFSLQQSKHISCGDGGITLVNNAAYSERARLFIDKGWDRKGGNRSHAFFGMNYRMTELQAAVARKQLQRLPQLIQSQRSSAVDLRSRLQDIPGITLPTEPKGAVSSWWIFHWLIKEDFYVLDPKAICGLLVAEGVRAKQGYLPRPMFDEAMLRGRHTFGRSGFPLNQFGYRDPAIADFPGTAQMLSTSILVSWGSKFPNAYVRQVSDAIHKVFDALQKKRV